MCVIPLPSSASYNGMIAPPGYPNTRSTPSARTHCRTISAPLGIHDLYLGLLRQPWLLGVFLQPGHHAAQLGSDLLDLVLFFLVAQRSKVLAALLVFLDPFPRKRSILNASQNLFHCLAGLVADNSFAA